MLRKLETGRKSGGRDKIITSPVTHNNVIYSICCLNWNAFITDYQGFQHDFQGLSWELVVHNIFKLHYNKFKSCPEL